MLKFRQMSASKLVSHTTSLIYYDLVQYFYKSIKLYYNYNSMNKPCTQNFELIQDIIKTLDFCAEESKMDKIGQLQKILEETEAGKFAPMPRVYDILNSETVTIICADSFIANELYLDKEKLLKPMKEKADKIGIRIKDLKFDYKKWKERNDE